MPDHSAQPQRNPTHRIHTKPRIISRVTTHAGLKSIFELIAHFLLGGPVGAGGIFTLDRIKHYPTTAVHSGTEQAKDLPLGIYTLTNQLLLDSDLRPCSELSELNCLVVAAMRNLQVSCRCQGG